MRSPFYVVLALLLFVLLFASIPPSALAQPGLTVKTWGGAFSDAGVAVDSDAGGNHYMVGATQSFGEGGADAFIVKYNASNGLVWQRTWGGRQDDIATAVAVDSNGSSYVAGFSSSFTPVNGDYVLLRFDPSGNLMWQKSGGGTAGVVVNSLGGVYVIGENSSRGFAQSTAILERFDALGNLVWARSWNGPTGDIARGLATDSAGNAYVVGDSYLLTGGYYYSSRAFLLKFNSFGNPVLQRIWAAPGSSVANDHAADVAVESSGAIYVTGTTDISEICNLGGTQATCTFPAVFLAKMNSTGNILWEKNWHTASTFGGGNPSNIGLDSSGNIYISGFDSYHGRFLMQVTPAGDLASWRYFEEHTTSYYFSTYSIERNISSDVYLASIVSSSPPYLLCSAQAKVQNTIVTQRTGDLNLGFPNISPQNLRGNTTAPRGNETYAGGGDAALVAYNPSFAVSMCAAVAISPLLSLTTIFAVSPLLFLLKSRRR